MNKVTKYLLNVWAAIKNDQSYLQHLEDVTDFLSEELKRTEKLLKATQDEAEFFAKKVKPSKKTK